jgi:hypothetical protein
MPNFPSLFPYTTKEDVAILKFFDQEKLQRDNEFGDICATALPFKDLARRGDGETRDLDGSPIPVFKV